MKALRYLANGLGLFIKIILIKPITFILSVTLKPLLIFAYKIYRLLRKELDRINLPIGQKILYPFTSRYFLHIMVVLITLAVTTNSLAAREIKLEEFGRKTLFTAIVAPDMTDETVEGVETISVNKKYQNQTGTLKAKIALEPDTSELEIPTSEEGTALVKITLPDTSLTGQPRESIEYYQVKGGDTISTIAGHFGISTNTILWANSLSATSLIKPGQTLSIPPVSGVLYKVQSGDSVSSIAKKFKAEENSLLEFNQLADASAIEVGQQIMVPGGEIEPPPPPPVATSRFASVFSGSAPPSARVPAGSRLLWPTPSHKINQYFTWRHRGLDIDGNYSSSIYAAENGTVGKVGWGTGYGNVIYISHGGGKTTIYAHLSKFFVKSGQQVSKGQTIGMMGCTGWCTGTHLHFEVVVGGSKVNPLSYL